MRILLFWIVLWLIFCLGYLDKGQKFWSLSTYINTAVLAIVGIAEALSPDGPSTSGERIAAISAIGAAFGLVYCILYAEKLRNEKRFPLAAGMVALIISAGLTLLFFDIMKLIPSN
jgi:drug/metabolite transporter (DMT)-like permease